MLDDTELQDTCWKIQKRTGLMDDAWKREFGNEGGLYGFIKARDAAVRIDELEQAPIQRFITVTGHGHSSVDGDYIRNRIAELRRESDLGRSKES